MCPRKLLWRLLHQQQQLSMQLLTHLVQLQAPTARLLPQAQVTLLVLFFVSQIQRTESRALISRGCMLHDVMWQTCANMQQGADFLDAASG